VMKRVQREDVDIVEKGTLRDLEERAKLFREISKGTLFSFFRQCGKKSVCEYFIAAYTPAAGERQVTADFLSSKFRHGLGSMPRIRIPVRIMRGLKIHRKDPPRDE